MLLDNFAANLIVVIIRKRVNILSILENLRNTIT